MHYSRFLRVTLCALIRGSMRRSGTAVHGRATSYRIFRKRIIIAFTSRFKVNSAVRTVKVQKKLRRHNRNAAPADGDTASSHLAGLTVDLQRRGMTRQQVHWMKQYLFYMKAQLVEPQEERHQWVFHIMVSGHYADWRETQDFVPMGAPRASHHDGRHCGSKLTPHTVYCASPFPRTSSPTRLPPD